VPLALVGGEGDEREVGVAQHDVCPVPFRNCGGVEAPRVRLPDEVSRLPVGEPGSSVPGSTERLQVGLRERVVFGASEPGRAPAQLEHQDPSAAPFLWHSP